MNLLEAVSLGGPYNYNRTGRAGVELLMRRSLAALILLGLPFFSAAAFPAAAAAGVGGVVVNVLPLPGAVGGSQNSFQHGRIEYRVQLKNTAKEDRVVHLQIPAPSAYRPDSGTIVSRTVAITAGQEAIVSLFQFPELYDGNMEVRVDGVREKETLAVGALTPKYYGSYGSEDESPRVLMSRSVSLDFFRLPADAAPLPASTLEPGDFRSLRELVAAAVAHAGNRFRLSA